MKHIAYYLFLICLLTSCYDLDKYPEGKLSSVGAFSTIKEIEKYLNQFYETGVKKQPGYVGTAEGIAFTDLNSDNLLSNVIDTRLAGETALSAAVDLDNYTYIRNVNFLINNLGNCKETGAKFYQCVGEAYYFRAWYYYQMFVNYGELTWVTEVIDPVQEQMERPRNSRIEIADNILADLDIAIEHLEAQSNNATMRVHKDVARALKSEVALFAGTWEKYHREKQDPFYDKNITNDKIHSYLQQAADAAKAVMDAGVWSISKGDPNTVYRDLFITLDLTGNPEVLWWKQYDATNNIGHSVTRYLNKGGGICGVSASLVDDYLTKDGKPFVGAERLEAKKVYGIELDPDLRDPRLSQTVCLPGQQLRPNGEYVFKFPPLDGNSYYQNTTGYSMLKYVEFDTKYTPTIEGDLKSQAPAIQYRYADVLLNYAEALAELDGNTNAAKIKEALKPLRERVGMPEVDFDREYNTSPDYPFRNLDKYIQAVRRERRVEKALEGCRLSDILRWAAADILIHGVTPIGALFVGSNLENNPFYVDANGKYTLKYDNESGNNLYLTAKPSDAERYIIPFNIHDYPEGWQFDLQRDYLLPIKPRMLSLTGNQWVQNPGW